MNDLCRIFFLETSTCSLKRRFTVCTRAERCTFVAMNKILHSLWRITLSRTPLYFGLNLFLFLIYFSHGDHDSSFVISMRLQFLLMASKHIGFEVLHCPSWKPGWTCCSRSFSLSSYSCSSTVT
jgi:hypothetical protein